MSEENQPNDQVLFVDSDSENLSAVLLELSASDFDLFIAQSIEQGEKILQNNKVDVVITNLQMAEGGIEEFLLHLKKNFPNTHRVVIYDASDEQSATDAISKGYATANIARPWEEPLLNNSIEHILKVRSTLKQKKLLESINEIDRLPSLPSLYQEFTNAVNQQKSMSEIAQIIECDVSLSARLLQIANSAFYGSASISSIDQAIMRLGTNSVKDLVMTFSFVNELDWSKEQFNRLQAIFDHSSLVNRLLKQVYQVKYGSPLKRDLACIGITHDIGKVIMLQYFPDRFNAIMDFQQAHPGTTFFESEIALGFDWFKHEEVGAYFLNMWNLADAVIETTLFHHDPEKAGEAVREAIDALAFINNLVGYMELLEDEEELDMDKVDTGFIPESALERILAEIKSSVFKPEEVQ